MLYIMENRIYKMELDVQLCF